MAAGGATSVNPFPMSMGSQLRAASPWQFLIFLPLWQGQGSFRLGLVRPIVTPA